MAETEETEQSLHATHVLEYPFRRSLGPILEKFFTGLAERRFIGSRADDGRVLVPPAEFDPVTAARLGEDRLIEVGPAGIVTTWTWVGKPTAKHPLDRPFAWALILLDGADAPFLHAVDAGGESAMRTGLRVQPRWAEVPQGSIRDVCWFEKED